jgi:hypothetical protein
MAAMYSWQQCGTGTLSYRHPRHLVIMNQWNGQQRAVTIKMFYMFGFLQCSHFFLCHPVHSRAKFHSASCEHVAEIKIDSNQQNALMNNIFKMLLPLLHVLAPFLRHLQEAHSS